MAESVLPWERQPKEPTKAFGAFCFYRDLPSYKRTFNAVVSDTGMSERTIIGWSQKYSWRERVEAWDDELDKQAREKHMEDLLEMRTRHARIAKKILDKMETAVDEMLEDEIKPSDIGRLVEVAAKIERMSRGDSGEIIEERDGGKAVNPVTFVMPKNGRDEDDED